MNTAAVITPLLDRIRTLYASMDEGYSRVAANYASDCSGCEDNCCTQRFHHHTLAEYHYLLSGLKSADEALRSVILKKAAGAVKAYQEGQSPMCPVNFDGLCRLYAYRPMICRLHGLPHEFQRPDGIKVLGAGCQRFRKLNDAAGNLDRTPFYAELAAIEKEFRSIFNFSGGIKKTTAMMLVEMAEALEKGDTV